MKSSKIIGCHKIATNGSLDTLNSLSISNSSFMSLQCVLSSKATSTFFTGKRLRCAMNIHVSFKILYKLWIALTMRSKKSLVTLTTCKMTSLFLRIMRIAFKGRELIKIINRLAGWEIVGLQTRLRRKSICKLRAAIMGWICVLRRCVGFLHFIAGKLLIESVWRRIIF